MDKEHWFPWPSTDPDDEQHDAHLADAYEHMAKCWNSRDDDEDDAASLCFFQRSETISEATPDDYDFVNRGR